MTVQFQKYPGSQRTPGVYAEIDATRANTGTVNQRTLIIGQQLGTGTFTAATPVIALSVSDTFAKAGNGSMLGLMLERYRKSDTFGEVWLLPLADDAAATKAATTPAAAAAPAA